MPIDELISFVRHLPQVDRRGRSEPLWDEPNAPSISRPRIPRDELANAPAIRDRGDLVLNVEREVSLDELPPDIRAPNAPIDTLAYYLPFHLYESDWGIYLRESGVLFVASILKGSRPGPGDSALLERGRAILLDHEYFHFQTEVACARAEVVASLRVYDSYFDDGRAAAHEEALANALAYRGLRGESAEKRDRVSEWMKRQGPGYQDFHRWVKPRNFRIGCGRAGQHMVKIISGSRPSRSAQADFLFDSMGRFKPPIYLVPDVSLAGVLKPFPKAHGMRVLVHTRDHPPPHIHIQRPPGRDFTRYLWPKLDPLSGDAELPSDGRKDLDAYLADYGREIDAKVQAVYPGAERGYLPSVDGC